MQLHRFGSPRFFIFSLSLLLLCEATPSCANADNPVKELRLAPSGGQPPNAPTPDEIAAVLAQSQKQIAKDRQTPISVDFAQTDIHAALAQIGTAANLNVVFLSNVSRIIDLKETGMAADALLQKVAGLSNLRIQVIFNVICVSDPADDKDISSANFSGRLISLNLQTRLENVLRIFAEITRQTLFVEGDASKEVMIKLIDVPWDLALQILAIQNGFQATGEAGGFRIRFKKPI